jgi:hypothetical protein
MRYEWTCPFCDRDCIITDSNSAQDSVWFDIRNKHGSRTICVRFVVCPNPKCREFTLSATMAEYKEGPSGTSIGNALQHWALIPPSSAKAFPEYVPNPILEDYREACLIMNLSPKASATLARRCLQGMIRDFGGIRKGNLGEEINELEERADPLTWRAIDAVRKVGNIGAHMHKDINAIVDVDSVEAEKLIGLIELLVRDWYITRYEREHRLKEIIAVGKSKTKSHDQSGAQEKWGT